MNYLVETKTEYTSQLINIISPFIYDGIQSLYDEALKVSKENEELRIFQNFLKKIPTWNPLILESETTRILKDSDCIDLLPQLLNAVIKSNIMVLTNTPPEKKYTIKLPKDIDFKKFIHVSYIETAKIIYNNPYLFYHKYSLYDIKKNQRDAKENIKNAINEAIRKLLPLQYILNEYLGENTSNVSKEQDFDKTVSETNKNILKKMITKQDLGPDLTSGINNDIIKLKEMLKNDPLDATTITESDEVENYQISPINNIKKHDSIRQEVIKQEPVKVEPVRQEPVRQEPVKVEPVRQEPVKAESIRQESVKQEIPTQSQQTYQLKKISNEEKQNLNNNESESVAYYINNSKIIDSFSNRSNMRSLFYSNEPEVKNTKSINTADVENYLKEQGQTTIKLSDDPNINSIKNVKTDKFKNKYYQV
jgi:hypothetical protein